MRRTIARRTAYWSVITALTCVPLAFHYRDAMPGFVAFGLLAACVAGTARVFDR